MKEYVMGTTKAQYFTEEQNTIADMARAIGHPARVAILECLLDANGCICSDFVNELPLAQSTISQHLKALKKVGIIKGKVVGTRVYYCIDKTVWREAREVFHVLFNAGQTMDDC